MCQCIAVFIFFLDIFPLIFIIFWFCLPEGGEKANCKNVFEKDALFQYIRLWC